MQQKSAAPTLAEAARALKPRAFALELTKGCNLRCGYCYYAGRETAYDPKARMSREVAYQSLEVLLRDGPLGQPAHVHFFGGEPLLDFELLRDVTLYGERRAREEQKALTLEVTTNGTRLEPEVIAFLNEHKIAVGVSFDGPPEVQDAARPLAGGSSYALAAPKIRALLASRIGSGLKTHASVVVTRLELDLVKIVRHLEELGFEKILLTPATDKDGGSNGLREQDLPRAFAAIDALGAEYERRTRAGERVSETWFPRLVGRVQSGERLTQFCSGGRDYLGVAADGKVALCYRFFEDERFAMGSVQAGLTRGVTERILAAPVDERTVCSRCWARHYCGGGCHHDNQTSSGAIETPNPIACELFRHGMDRALDAWGRLTHDGALPGGRRAPLSSRAMEPQPIAADARPRLVAGTHTRALGEERIVYDPSTHEVVALNESAAFILGLCDGTRGPEQLLAALEQRYAAPRERLQADLEATLRELYAKRLVTG
ncbi:MAG: PqqD family peptide modification chaperone [Planctomycetes bacterium]|nr:PqqD family peptide modification chaperone [Planctomycetota bacterium]